MGVLYLISAARVDNANFDNNNLLIKVSQVGKMSGRVMSALLLIKGIESHNSRIKNIVEAELFPLRDAGVGEIRAGLSAGADFLNETAHGRALADQHLYDVFLYFSSFDENCSERLRCFADSADGLLNLEACAVIVGQEWRRMKGDGPLMVALPWRRPSGMTQEEAQTYWHDEHGALVRGRGSLRGYRQIHADESASRKLAQQLGFAMADYDGSALLHAPSIQALKDVFSRGDMQGSILEDEMRFIDHRRSTLQAFEIF